MSAWTDQLQPASWRNIPFKVLVESGQFGRRIALHQYPFRDTPWPEDIGRSARKPSFTGYLIGDDALVQMRRMIAASEQKGEGTLVHPTLGTMSAVLLEPMGVVNRWDSQRVVELEFKFVEAGGQDFPLTITSTKSATLSSASDADSAASGDFFTEIDGALKSGSAVVKTAIATANDWIGKVDTLAADATSLTHMVGSLTGANYGRYFSGNRPLSALAAPTTTLNDLIGIGVAANRTVVAATDDVASVAQALGA